MGHWDWGILASRDGMMLVVGIIMGTLFGIMITICVYAWLRGAPARAVRRQNRRIRRAWKRAQLAQQPDLFSEYERGQTAVAGRRAPRDINDFVEGTRNRPTFNPNSGPRDW